MLRIDALYKSFRERCILKDVSFEVTQGHLTGLRGPSGVGKSTLFRCIAGLESYEAGTVMLDGVSTLGGLICPRITLVTQSYDLWPHMTAGENIELPRRSYARALSILEVSELLRRLDIGGLTHRFPRELSGGQRQRFALARAIALRPEYLLLDEPTSALDDQLTVRLLEILEELARAGTAVMVSTHDRWLLDALEAIPTGGRTLELREGMVLPPNMPGCRTSSDTVPVQLVRGC